VKTSGHERELVDGWPYLCSRCMVPLPRPLTHLCIDCLRGAHDDNCQRCHGDDVMLAAADLREFDGVEVCIDQWHDEVTT
jgi:hypothetical protein